ncbi:MAG: alpha/beta hydrolase [Rhodospirillaceae bacterium]|jgi:arylformamidase|nr:alpha/beta hydrolase [Rhodospirillaceae bacterium]MBT3911055.1 alpha/beta hydrolase [Rhodospirillaceae bacterium]MBT5297729.1 alpha/beta hydrolase [Rhodospirillaceae bacterium]MBT5516095.1 alpha/beta hydrolase [Rhodospirillaceae bacterium]MBT6606989.1 alpha/beta hydrolase [Rhodospirillaceae bacterium]
MNAKVFRDFDQAGLDFEYNNRQRVPEFEQLYESWVAPCHQVINDFDTRLGLTYGTSGREIIDLIQPAGTAPTAVNLYIHGGYWMSRDISDQRFIARPFVEAGAAFGLIEYDLMPGVRMADIVDQCRRAVAWVYDNADDLNLDRERIFVSGHSAGGHLTAMVVATDWVGFCGGPADLVKGGCAISGIYELEPIHLTYMQATLELTDEEVRDFSPIRFPETPKTPLLVVPGESESAEFRRQSREFVDDWNAKDGNCTYLEAPGCNHFTILPNFADPTSALTRATFAQMGLG